MGNLFSLRLRDAWTGAIGVFIVVLGVIMGPVAASLGLIPTTIVFLFFSPAMVIAVYSLCFERSKFYGILAVS